MPSCSSPPPQPGASALRTASLLSRPAGGRVPAPPGPSKPPPLWGVASPHLLWDRPESQHQPSRPLSPGGVSSGPEKGRGFWGGSRGLWGLGAIRAVLTATWEPCPKQPGLGIPEPCPQTGRGSRPSHRCTPHSLAGPEGPQAPDGNGRDRGVTTARGQRRRGQRRLPGAGVGGIGGSKDSAGTAPWGRLCPRKCGQREGGGWRGGEMGTCPVQVSGGSLPWLGWGTRGDSLCKPWGTSSHTLRACPGDGPACSGSSLPLPSLGVTGSGSWSTSGPYPPMEPACAHLAAGARASPGLASPGHPASRAPLSLGAPCCAVAWYHQALSPSRDRYVSVLAQHWRPASCPSERKDGSGPPGPPLKGAGGRVHAGSSLPSAPPCPPARLGVCSSAGQRDRGRGHAS